MVPLPDPDRLPSQRVFDNPDGFAMAFSEAWDEYERQNPGHGLERDAKLKLILESLAEHPFLQREPEQAQQLVQFRMRLLGY